MYYYIMFLLGKIRQKYFNQIPENNKQYLNSRRAFTVDGITATTIISLVANSYLSGFLEYIGVPVALNGIISAVPALVAISQPVGAILGQRFKRKKMFVALGAIIHRLMFTFMFAVPFLVKDTGNRVVWVIILFSVAHFINSFISPAASNWLISLTPQRVRGKYYSIRELYSIVFMSAICMIAGYILDYFDARNQQTIAYVLIAVIVGILAIVNFISLSSVMEPESAEQREINITITKAFLMPFKEKSFRPIIVMNLIWNIGIQIAIPYFGLYLVSDLSIPYVIISVLGVMGGILRAASVKLWGRLADKTSWALACKISILIIAISHLGNAFLVPSNSIWLYSIFNLFASIGWAVINIAFINIQYDYAPAKGRTIYIGVNAAITGVIGFFSVFIGAFVMKFVEKYNPVLFGLSIKGQQILMFISGIILIICCLYINFVVQKNNKIINKMEGMAV